MITTEELKNISRIKGLNNIGYAEKDYLIDLVLLSISKNTKNELVFKGGTCLYKFYKLDRFSEDIDFIASRSIKADELIEKIIKDLSLFGVDSVVHSRKEPLNSMLFSLICKCLLYKNTSQTLSTIRIDINLKSSIDLEPVNAKYSSLYSDIPAFSLLVMNEKEILAEKIRALVARNKARDLYDVGFLLEKGIEIDKDLVVKKLQYYKLDFNKKLFEKAVEEKHACWEKELKPFISTVPDFKKIKKLLMSKI